MKKLILNILLFSSSWAWAAGPTNLVLVPGFFSSAIPAPERIGNPWEQPYFSQDIVNHLAKRTTRLWVVDTLNPVGGIEENGQRLVRFLERRKADFQGAPVVLMGHSAGGLYALYAAANSDVEINHVITLSTPFRGLRLLHALEEKGLPVSFLTAPFCLDNLLGLKTGPVRKFVSDLVLKRPLKLDIFAGFQTTGLFVWDWKYLSSPLIPFQSVIEESSDGIVNVQSALNASDILVRNQAMVQLTTHQQRLPIEHWEMILDAKLTKLYGVLNYNDLRRAQLNIYSEVLRKSGY